MITAMILLVTEMIPVNYRDNTGNYRNKIIKVIDMQGY